MFNKHLHIIGGSLHNILQLVNSSIIFQQMILHSLIKIISLLHHLIQSFLSSLALALVLTLVLAQP
jgi:hypothetical protein